MGIFKEIFIKKAKLYTTCREMPLHNFSMYLETNDLLWFSVDHKESDELKEAMTTFFTEYIELTKNKSITNRFVKMHKMMKIDVKYRSVSILLKAIYNHKLGKVELEELIEELRKWGYKVYKEKDLFLQIETIHNRIQNLKTQYEILQIELDKEGKKESVSIEKQLIAVAKSLELNYPLKAKEISVLEWIEYQNMLKEKK